MAISGTRRGEGAGDLATLSRGLRVLETLAETSEEQTASEFSRAVGLPRPVLYRLLATMVAHRLVRRGPQGGYVVAPRSAGSWPYVLPALGMDAHAVLRQLRRGVRSGPRTSRWPRARSPSPWRSSSGERDLPPGLPGGLPAPGLPGGLGRGRSWPAARRSLGAAQTGEVIPGTSGGRWVLGLGTAAAVGVVAPQEDLDLSSSARHCSPRPLAWLHTCPSPRALWP